MHRLDLLMCLYKRVFEVAPQTGATCPIAVHMGKRLAAVRQDQSSATATFTDGSKVEGDVVVGADGINSKTLQLLWPDAPPRRWTEVTCYRGLIPREKVATLKKDDGSPMDYNPIDSFSMDARKTLKGYVITYWVRGGGIAERLDGLLRAGLSRVRDR
jgi:salicylate hydroxylase